MSAAERERLEAAFAARVAETADETAAQDYVDELDRKELVIPAPKGFKPRVTGRLLRAKLFLRDKKIRVGERLWYRLELQNIGGKPIFFRELHSFLKDGSEYGDGRYSFLVTEPGGTRRHVGIGRWVDSFLAGSGPQERRRLEIPPGTTAAEARALARQDALRRAAASGIRQTLEPGEALRSRPWRWYGNAELYQRYDRGETDLRPAPPGEFRELWTEFEFDKPGKYRVQFEFLDVPLKPLSEEEFNALDEAARARHLRFRAIEAQGKLGRVLSNFVEVEVVP